MPKIEREMVDARQRATPITLSTGILIILVKLRYNMKKSQ